METILITGATSGLGLSHAIYLSSKGYNVIGASRNAANVDLVELKRVFIRDHTKHIYEDKEHTKVRLGKCLLDSEFIAHLENWIDKIKFITLDITNTESVRKGVDQAIKIGEELGCKLSILINNAGNGFFGSIEELSIESTKLQFETNYYGQIRMIQSVVPYFRKNQSGLIINTASMAGLISIPFEGHYSATKAAIMRMSESLRMELKPFNVRVATIVPGDINTNFNVHTVQLHGGKKTQEAVDLPQLIASNPTESTSAYKKYSDNPWRKIIENVIIAPPPMKVSLNVEKIIKSSRPKMHNLTGNIPQSILMWLQRRIASDNFGIYGAGAYYGVNRKREN